MNILLMPLCWWERHHWLLTETETLSIYEDNGLPREERYYYQCQRCGGWTREKITNLDNAPKLKEKRL